MELPAPTISDVVPRRRALRAAVISFGIDGRRLLATGRMRLFIRVHPCQSVVDLAFVFSIHYPLLPSAFPISGTLPTFSPLFS